jgi:glutamyl/glutaminyl-tRNA synthetase
VLDYVRDGFLPETLVSFIATLGWNDGTEQEIFTREELIQKFSLGRVQHSGAHFDEQRLLWMNGHFIRQLPLDDLYDKVRSYWPASAAEYDDTYKKSVLALVQERLKFFKELPVLTNFFFEDLPVNPELITTNKQLKKLEAFQLQDLLEQAEASLAQSDFTVADLTERLNELLDITGQKPGVLFSLIRIATTQAAASPSLAESLAVLGKDRTLARLRAQIAAL